LGTTLKCRRETPGIKQAEEHMNNRKGASFVVVPFVLLAGCVPAVMAPTVVATPGFGKSPAEFAADHSACAVLADQQVAAAKTAANNQIFGSALLGAAVGGGGTAANGGSNGDVAANAAGNALSAGAATAQTAQATVQRQYDFDYGQCMFAKGNVVPGFAPPIVAEPEEPTPPVRHRVRHAHKKPTENQASVGSSQPAGPQAGGFVEPAPVQPASASGGGFAVPPPAVH
jgi:hypothetical protein